MLFNSLAFLLFFPLVTIGYWVLPGRYRNAMLLVASYYFYMSWKPVYALLILFSTLTTWFCGIKMGADQRRNKRWLTLCLVVNLAILFSFKYLNFAAGIITDVLQFTGLGLSVPEFDILLPVGISFYTFQAIGYTIDVYRGNIAAERHLGTYALFVSFFPQLVAGPIERASNLLPQFHARHAFDGNTVTEGLRLMVWGYFMKLCIAENVAPYVDAVFNNLPNHNGTSVWLATLFFTFQIFCDFGGYSLIAIGAARCMGFTLMQNFKRPYLSPSVKEFWHRWHISLSSWFGEYVYIPLGGSRCSEARHQRNLLVTMLVSGLWHGANWTFVCWGGLHGLLLSLYSLKRKFLPWATLGTSAAARTVNVAITFVLAMLCWVFFRANTMHDALLAFNKMFTQPGLLFNGEGKPALLMAALMIALLIAKELKDELGWHRLDLMHSRRSWLAIASTAAMVIVILLCGNFSGGQFIYFQF